MQARGMRAVSSVLDGDDRARVYSAAQLDVHTGAEAYRGEAADANLHGTGISPPRRQVASHREGPA